MKKKIILITFIGAIISVIIYIYTKNDKINLVAIGDGLALGMTPYNIEGYSYNDYLKEYYENKHNLKKYYNLSENGKTIKELIYEIKENKRIEAKNKKIEIQRAINEANILTLAIGIDELSDNSITKNIIKEYHTDIKELLSIIKTLNKEKVIILSLYTNKPREKLNIMKLNAILKEETLGNNFIFIDISNLLENKIYYFNNQTYYINYEGHKAIYNEIRKVI